MNQTVKEPVEGKHLDDAVRMCSIHSTFHLAQGHWAIDRLCFCGELVWHFCFLCALTRALMAAALIDHSYA